ncbi:MAG: tRNA (adenosine(37)-N6)-dimethylallyltransferase MiaA [Chitinophagaceae bacterium]|nr:MAG: tRNA (adenosine(37)-N6)-dimethylallyltransferase MiaA [Chitinophagaceae bacterium]
MKTVILITGPTASGKTSLALQAAKHYNTEIISADSRQCFKEMSIGVAKPADEELASVPHHFINSHSIHEEVNAATFARYAHAAAEKIFENHDVLILVGGTGLYIKAFLEGLDAIPEIPGDVRAEILSDYESRGLVWLQREVEVADPKFFAEGEIQNPQRLMRALEVVRGTGKSIRYYQKGRSEGAMDKYDVKKFAIDIPRERLYENINLRVESMIEDGLVDEVMVLAPYRHLNALQTVGYSELFEHFDGLISIDEAVEKIKKNTRHYAKRQMTWFRKDADIVWINALHQLL